MGLSLSVLVALMFLMPGASFLFGLARFKALTGPTSGLEEHLPLSLAAAVVFALVSHLLWFELWAWYGNSFNHPVPDLRQFATLLAGEIAGEYGALALKSIQKFPCRIGLYFAGLSGLSWGLGRFVRRFLSEPPEASWYDLLKPEDEVAFVWLTADLHLDGKCFLYSGWVREFAVARDGTLDRVVLGSAWRKPLSDAPANWLQVEGEFVVLKLASACTINVDYFYEASADDNESPDANAGASVDA